MNPNIFDYGTSELSNTTIIYWMLKWGEFKDSNLYDLSKDLVQLFVEDYSKNIEINNIELYKDFIYERNIFKKHIDILIKLNDKYIIIIGDNAESGVNLSKGNDYRYILEKDEIFADKIIVYIYLEIGEEPTFKSIEKNGYKVGILDANALQLSKYEVVKKMKFDSISRGEYITLLFTPYKKSFNNYNDYDSTVVNVYRLPMGKNSLLRKRLTYLVSHISNNDGIIGLQTVLNDEFKEMVEISFVDTMTNSNQVHQLLNSDTLKFTYSNGTTGKIENMFHFSAMGIKKEKE